MSDGIKPENWEKKNLGDILDVLTDYTANGSFEALRINVRYYYEPNYAALVRTTDLGKSEFKPKVFTDEKGYIFQRKTALFGGEIVLANVGSIGKVYKVPLYPAPMTLAPNTYLVKFSQSVSQNYIFHFLNSDQYVRQLFQKIGSTALAAINKASFRSIEAILPKDKAEQSTIAQVLDTLDTAIHQTEAIIAKLKAVKQGLLHDLLTRGIDANGELRPPLAEAPQLYKQSPMGWIPQEWGTPLLQNVSTRVTDGTHQAVTTVADGGGEVPFLFVSCVRDGEIAWDKAATITKRDYWRISKGREPAAGMILYTAVGSYGHAAEVSDTREFAFQRHIACIYPDERYVVAGFMPLVLNWEPMRGYADRVALGNAQKTITLGELSQYPFICPKKTEQEEIVSRMRSAQEKLNGEVESLNKLRLQKSGLMDDLLTGRVRVTPLMAEAAQLPGSA